MVLQCIVGMRTEEGEAGAVPAGGTEEAAATATSSVRALASIRVAPAARYESNEENRERLGQLKYGRVQVQFTTYCRYFSFKRQAYLYT